jgi:8-oxo-dGTP diphosphatase
MQWEQAYMNQSVGIKIVVFSVVNGHLLTYMPKGALPSRQLSKGADLEREVSRTIPFTNGYVEQLYTLSGENTAYDITIVYFVLIAERYIQKKEDWEVVSDQSIVEYAKKRLQWKIEYTNIVYSLLPDEFVFGQLQHVYEAILGKTMDKRNFRKKIFSLNILKSTGKKRALGRARPAEVYAFKERKLAFVEIL